MIGAQLNENLSGVNLLRSTHPSYLRHFLAICHQIWSSLLRTFCKWSVQWRHCTAIVLNVSDVTGSTDHWRGLSHSTLQQVNNYNNNNRLIRRCQNATCYSDMDRTVKKHETTEVLVAVFIQLSKKVTPSQGVDFGNQFSIMTARSKFVFQTASPVREQSVQNVVLVPQLKW